MPDKSEVDQLIIQSLSDLREDLELPPIVEPSRATELLGGGSDLDSMAVVHLIADLEGRLEEAFGKDWILADERALSRSRSPFRTIGDLSDFIIETTPEP